MQRLTEERGAVSVMVALLMIPLLLFAALAIDIAALHAERQQLQTGADAAALAVAQDCARNSCGTPALTAQTLAAANSNDGTATAVVAPAPTPASGQVTVRTSGVAEHAFGGVLGFDETAISASATASWGSPTAGTAILPVAISLCEFLAQTGGGLPSGTAERTIFFTKTTTTGCTPTPSGNVVPGGFGWLQPNAGGCRVRSAIGDVLLSDSGASVPSGCATGDFARAQNRTVLLPLFDDAGDSGSNAWYRLYGYAAFRVTGYHFVGQYSWSEFGTCKGSARCIQGYFVQFVDLADAFEYSAAAPRLGAAVVSLTE